MYVNGGQVGRQGERESELKGGGWCQEALLSGTIPSLVAEQCSVDTHCFTQHKINTTVKKIGGMGIEKKRN